MAGDGGKYKGGGHHPRSGLGRLRRAGGKSDARLGGWVRHSEDDGFLDRHGAFGRRSHTGEALLARFNRLAEAPGEAGDPGRVCGFLGKDVLVRGPDGVEHACTVREALKKRVSGVKNPFCVGDRVRFQVESGAGVVVGLEPRRNLLARADSHNKSLVHVLAANLDRLVVVAAVATPEIRYGFVDRYLLIAAASDVPASVVVNKTDLGDARPAVALYRGIGYPAFATSTAEGSGVDDLRGHLAGLATVVAGQSGVGKSSLVNALYPGLGARVGATQVHGGLGRHTTTAARSYLLPDGGELIDTPGIRECGISGLAPVDVALLYPDIAAVHGRCRFADCTHRHEPDCAVVTAVERGEIAVTRYASYRSVLDEDLAAS